MRATHRSSRSVRGWDRVKPKLRGERARVYSKCGCSAFLACRDLKYPIVAKSGPCAVSCKGLRAAKARAAQHHHPALVRKADHLGRRAGCSWAR